MTTDLQRHRSSGRAVPAAPQTIDEPPIPQLTGDLVQAAFTEQADLADRRKAAAKALTALISPQARAAPKDADAEAGAVALRAGAKPPGQKQWAKYLNDVSSAEHDLRVLSTALASSAADVSKVVQAEQAEIVELAEGQVLAGQQRIATAVKDVKQEAELLARATRQEAWAKAVTVGQRVPKGRRALGGTGINGPNGNELSVADLLDGLERATAVAEES